MSVRFDCATLSGSSGQLNQEGQSLGANDEVWRMRPFSARSWRSFYLVLYRSSRSRKQPREQSLNDHVGLWVCVEAGRWSTGLQGWG